MTDSLLLNDIELISDHEEDELDAITQPMIAEGEISVVSNISDYLVCINCAGNVRTVSKTMGSYTKCNATVKLSKCKANQSACLIIVNDNDKKWQPTAYNKQLQDIITTISGDSITERLLAVTHIKVIGHKKCDSKCTHFSLMI